MEQEQGTTVSGAKIRVVEQVFHSPYSTTLFEVEYPGSLWSPDHILVVSEPANHCHIYDIQILILEE
jgi:hypothetical protein